VNVDRIQAVESLLGGEYLMVLHDGTKLSSGRSYRRSVHALLGKEG
jgi:DNA-binding LytR/AlgR family response regulator